MGKNGRPPHYTSAEDMQAKIDEYFESCKGKPMLDANGGYCVDKNGKPIFIGARPPTVTGLAFTLGFHSRQTLLNYQGKASYMDTVTRAKLRIEAYAEERLYDRDGQRGAEFSLKYNFRWANQSEDDDDEGTGVVELPPVMEAPQPPKAAEDDDDG